MWDGGPNGSCLLLSSCAFIFVGFLLVVVVVFVSVVVSIVVVDVELPFAEMVVVLDSIIVSL